MSLAVELRRLNLVPKGGVYVYLFGHSKVGKSSLKISLQKLIRAAFKVLINTEENFENYVTFIDDTIVPSAEHLRSGSVLVLYVYDVCDESSIDSIQKLCKSQLTSQPTIATVATRIVVGNKIDLEYWRRVPVTNGRSFAACINASHFEVSAFTGLHIDILCDIILREIFVSFKDSSIVSSVLSALRHDIEKRSHISYAGIIRDEEETSLREAEEEEVSEEEEMSWDDEDNDDVDFFGGEPSSAVPLGAGLDDLFLGTPPPPQAPAVVSDVLHRMAPVPPPLPRSGLPPPPPPRGAPAGLPPPTSSAAGPPPPRRAIVSDIKAPSAPVALKSISGVKPKGKAQLESLQKKKVVDKREKETPVGEAAPRRQQLSALKEDAASAPDATLNILQEERKVASKKRSKKPAPRLRRDEESGEAEQMRELSALTQEIDEVQSIMLNNLDDVLARGEKLEALEVQAATLELQSATFQKKSVSLRRQFAVLVCLPCVMVGYCCEGMYKCARSTCTAAINCVRALCNAPKLFDNVLADNENAFQTLAKFLVFIQDSASCSCGAVVYALAGVWVELMAWIFSYITVAISTLLLILPSFFTLLVIRTTKIETESKAFGGRSYTY